MIDALHPPKTAQALIFDCDGTLAVTRHAHFEALRQAFAAQGFVLAEAWYIDHTGLSLNETCHALAAHQGAKVDAEAVRAMHAALYPTLMPLVRVVPEMAAIAQAWAERLPLSVASGGDQAIVEMTLERIGLRPLFAHVVAIGEITKGKPAPDLFLAAAERMGVNAAACHVYEDSDEGMEAASRAGMTATDVRRISGIAR